MKKSEVRPGAIAILLNSYMTKYDNRDKSGKIRKFELTGRTRRENRNTYIEAIEISTGETRWMIAGRLKLEETENAQKN